jgi:hypothetical protein
MYSFKRKTALEKASSSPIVYKQNSSVSLDFDHGHRSYTFGQINADNDSPESQTKTESPKYTLCEIRQDVPMSNKTLANLATPTQFANDFIATIHGLYREVGGYVLPVSEKKYDKVTEKITLDAAVFFQQYATENIQQAGNEEDMDVQGEAKDIFPEWNGQDGERGVLAAQDVMHITSDDTFDKRSRLSHQTDTTGGKQNSFTKGKGKAARRH